MIRGNRPVLTHKERAVVVHLAAGLKPKQISAALGISRHTYQRRITIMRAKFGAMNDVQIGILIERYQIIPVDQRNRIEDRREERLSAQ